VLLKQLTYLKKCPKKAFENIKKEINIISQIKSNFTVTYYGYYIEDNSINIVMELIDGDNLTKSLEKIGNNWKIKIEIALKIVTGLCDLHNNNPIILHLDLKPDNILVSHDLKFIKITDFGLSKSYSCMSRLGVTAEGNGTFLYMAPEQILKTDTKKKGEKINSKADVYSFGCVLYEICVNNNPWYWLNDIVEIIREIKNSDIHINYVHDDDIIPREFGGIIDNCRLKDPKSRASSKDICVELRNLLDRFQ